MRSPIPSAEDARRRTFWYVLLVASFLAAGVSLLTTALGLNRYLSALLAWPLALAVQLGLFGLAWLIAVGRGERRLLIVVLYCLTMPFSVVFSYVLLQSELTAGIRPQESQRALYDDLRRRAGEISAELNRSVASSEELGLRLGAWLELERTTGWTVSTCDEEDHCYLTAACDRLRRKVASWEQSYDRPYRQGPGEELIYGQLRAEAQSLGQIRASLVKARRDWTENGELFASGIDNRERLLRFDAARGRLPLREMEAVQCTVAALPPSPDYESFARDVAMDEERPLYAFSDLTRLFERSYTLQRSDYPTLFAFFLALFIDLFVLLVALGAGVLEDGGSAPSLEAAPPPWGVTLRRQIEAWIDGSLLQRPASGEERRAFLGRVMDAFRFERGRQAVLVPENDEQNRFGFFLAQSRAATAAGDRDGVSFVVEDWVYPALAQYLTAEA